MYLDKAVLSSYAQQNCVSYLRIDDIKQHFYCKSQIRFQIHNILLPYNSEKYM